MFDKVIHGVRDRLEAWRAHPTAVTACKLTTLKRRIDDYETSQPRPRQDRANTQAATLTLPDPFDATDDILNDCLDGLMA
jgi:hypothetical protein